MSGTHIPSTLVALTRPVPPSINECELTHAARVPIEYGRAVEQHRAYGTLLSELGCEARELPALPEHPDSVFIEDTAVVLDEIALVTRPGAESRRGEVSAVAEALRFYRRVEEIVAPATLDGGDVLCAGKQVFVGLSSRTNAQGAIQLERLLSPYGYEIRLMEVRDCLHLKSAVTMVGEGLLLINREWIDAAAFHGFTLIDCDPRETAAANALLVGDTVVCASGFSATTSRLRAAGLRIRTVDASELAKAEGGLTCCSLIFSRS